MTSEAESQVFQPDEDESFWQLVRANGDAEVRSRTAGTLRSSVLRPEHLL